jgi:hypothetical protein
MRLSATGEYAGTTELFFPGNFVWIVGSWLGWECVSERDNEVVCLHCSLLP